MKNTIDKLMSRSALALTDNELLSLLLEDESLACRLMAEGGSLAVLAGEDIARLRMREGMGLHRAQRLAVAAEFGRRVVAEGAEPAVSIATSDDVVALFRPQMESLRHEECWAIYLSSSNGIIERRRESQGGVQCTVVDHRLIVKRSLELLATQLILVHNHPSGMADPSEQDKELTDKISRAAALFDIRLLDHIIIARTGHFSFLQAGLISK